MPEKTCKPEILLVTDDGNLDSKMRRKLRELDPTMYLRRLHSDGPVTQTFLNTYERLAAILVDERLNDQNFRDNPDMLIQRRRVSHETYEQVLDTVTTPQEA